METTRNNDTGKEITVGQKVKTVYGELATVHFVLNDSQIIVQINGSKSWTEYHPSNVFGI